MKRPADRCGHALTQSLIHSFTETLLCAGLLCQERLIWGRGADRRQTIEAQRVGDPILGLTGPPVDRRTPRCHTRGRRTTDGCPGGSQAGGGMGFVDKRGKTYRGPSRGRQMAPLGGGAGSAPRAVSPDRSGDGRLPAVTSILSFMKQRGGEVAWESFHIFISQNKKSALSRPPSTCF